MSLTYLNQSGAFKSGAEIWAIPDLADSDWTRKIDWYLNFQVLRAKKHRPAQIPEPLQEIAEQWDVDIPRYKGGEQAPLMIVSSMLLPNQITLVLHKLDDQQQWVTACHRLWISLGRKSLRLFLPPQVTSDDIEKYWPEEDKRADVSLINEKP